MTSIIRAFLIFGIVCVGPVACGAARSAPSDGVEAVVEDFGVSSASTPPSKTSPAAESIAAPSTPARNIPASSSVPPKTRFLLPGEAPFVPGAMDLRGTWDFIVLFRGEPFGGTLTLPVSTGGTKGTMVLPGWFEGAITVIDVDPIKGTLTLSFETPRGTATLKCQFESARTIAGSLEDVLVGVPGISVPMRRLDESALFSATRR